MARITSTTAGDMACSYALSRLISGEPEKKEAAPPEEPATTKSGTNAVEGSGSGEPKKAEEPKKPEAGRSEYIRPIHRTDPDFQRVLQGKTPGQL